MERYERKNDVCPRCGAALVFFYNAGAPMLGCKACYDSQRLKWLTWATNTNEQPKNQDNPSNLRGLSSFERDHHV